MSRVGNFLGRFAFLLAALAVMYGIGPMFEGVEDWRFARYRTDMGSIALGCVVMVAVVFLLEELGKYTKRKNEARPGRSNHARDNVEP